MVSIMLTISVVPVSRISFTDRPFNTTLNRSIFIQIDLYGKENGLPRDLCLHKIGYKYASRRPTCTYIVSKTY